MLYLSITLSIKPFWREQKRLFPRAGPAGYRQAIAVCFWQGSLVFTCGVEINRFISPGISTGGEGSDLMLRL
jgi:hypothetical protein